MAGLSYSGICFAICEALEKSSYDKRNNMQNSECFGPVGSVLRVGFVMNAVALADICLRTLDFLLSASFHQCFTLVFHSCITAAT
jgi:hypothetical protein